MNVEIALYDRLSSLADGRVYPTIMPHGATVPTIIYTMISADRMRSLAGATALINAVIQVDAWDRTYGGAKALAAQIRAALDPYGADMRVGGISENADFFESETGLYRSSADYSIWAEK